ncbi:hypothetical protein PENANT_c040G04825 [Penicillium antarcticum]|uniref:Uncharacterized protein n=1 Tax=Penicillium antarcticum TaxID=416450 RepID=A0A1V6PSV0_9EURO|nr:hypothetical protein PENANT_c040G04825 [Penicillium antarcticum]
MFVLAIPTKEGLLALDACKTTSGNFTVT